MITKLAAAKKRELIGILDALCQELELTATQRKDAEEKYTAVGNWLHERDPLLQWQPDIFAQGSIMLETTVRPIGRAEFDVDLVCRLTRGSSQLSQAFVRNLIGTLLQANETYKKMLEPLNRGWRLNYAGAFHMDITPGVPNQGCQNGGIWVPDKELKTWKASNPSGYVKWFNGIASIPVRRPVSELAEKRAIFAKVEPLPAHRFTKPVLKRAVQVYKRHRDQYFGTRKEAPISIIITTLASQAYGRLVTTREYETDFDLLYDILELMPCFIGTQGFAGGVLYTIPNPTTDGENFAEKWNKHPERAAAFFEWRKNAMVYIEKLAETADINPGIDNIGKHLESLGEEAKRGIQKYAASRVTIPRSNGSLRVSPSFGLGLSGTQVATNTFFGA